MAGLRRREPPVSCQAGTSTSPCLVRQLAAGLAERGIGQAPPAATSARQALLPEHPGRVQALDHDLAVGLSESGGQECGGRAARSSSPVLACPIAPLLGPSRQHHARPQEFQRTPRSDVPPGAAHRLQCRFLAGLRPCRRAPNQVSSTRSSRGPGLARCRNQFLGPEFDSTGRVRQFAGSAREFREIGASGQEEFYGRTGAAGTGEACPLSRRRTLAPDPFMPAPTSAPGSRYRAAGTSRPPGLAWSIGFQAQVSLPVVRGHPRTQPVRPGCAPGGGHQHCALGHPDRRDRSVPARNHRYAACG